MANKEMEELLRSWGFEPGLKAGNMTLRDWFAGQAMAALIRNKRMTGYQSEKATDAFQHPDAMMRRRCETEYEPTCAPGLRRMHDAT